MLVLLAKHRPSPDSLAFTSLCLLFSKRLGNATTSTTRKTRDDLSSDLTSRAIVIFSSSFYANAQPCKSQRHQRAGNVEDAVRCKRQRSHF